MEDCQNFFATAPKGLELLLRDELLALGATSAAEKRAGVAFTGTLAFAYKACLWTRLANRILFPLTTFPAADPEALYAGIQTISWQEHFSVTNTFAVDFNTAQSSITHTQYGAQKVKDAIVDQFRDQTGERPSVDLENPDIRINIYLNRDVALVSLDLSGGSLHRRGYRSETGAAPLKENLAAAILLRAGWPAIAASGGALLDPMCGVGTLPIEAAMMAADIAPGLLRERFGFMAWRKYDENIWPDLLNEAKTRRDLGLKNLPPIVGYDADPLAIKIAFENIQRAGLSGHVHVEKRELATCKPVANKSAVPGLFIVNPPYGERLGEVDELVYLYQHLGEKLKAAFQGWHAGVFTGNVDLCKHMGLRARKIYSLFNGALECKLLNFDVSPQWFFKGHKEREESPTPATSTPLSSGAQMFANRIEKNLKHIGRWARKENISCYRLYDADLPEYAVAVDLYENWVHVQEYAPPKTIDLEKAEIRLQEALDALSSVLNIPVKHIFLKVRERQKGRAQYEKLSAKGQFYQVHEGEAKFLVNFTDYLDTGLFLDQRLTRAFIQQIIKGKRFLNLFAYTGTATVYAALGGASATTTVDLSATYLAWARRNLALNGFSDQKHQFIQADCLEWLQDGSRRYDVILLDPPTFSNSKRMEDTLDIQRDHVALIEAAMRLLEPEGVLIFSNNKRNFKLDLDALQAWHIENFTTETIPKDFSRNPRIHHCWKIKHRER